MNLLQLVVTQPSLSEAQACVVLVTQKLNHFSVFWMLNDKFPLTRFH